MTHHTAKANLEKGSSWPPEAEKNILYHPKVVLLKSNISTPWTHPTMRLGPGALLRVFYYKLILTNQIAGKLAKILDFNNRQLHPCTQFTIQPIDMILVCTQ